MKISELKQWDIQDQLNTPEDMAAYLDAALMEDDPDFFLTAVGDVVKAMGAKNIAAQMGHGEKSLYKSFKPGAKPRYDTVFKMLQALGLRIRITPDQSC